MSKVIHPDECDHPLLAFRVEQYVVGDRVMYREIPNSDHCQKCGKQIDRNEAWAREAK